MACRLTIDLSPPLSPALLPPEVYAELYRSYVSAYRSLGFVLLGQNSPKARPASPQTPPRPRPGPPGTPSLPRCLVQIILLAGHLGFRGKPIGTSPQHPELLSLVPHSQKF